MIREIITKAVIGKGTLHQKQNYNLPIENNVDEVLGCWIVGHQYEAFMKNNHLYVKGSYDVNVWYSLEHENQSNVYVHQIEYVDEVPLKTKEEIDFHGDIMLVCTCPFPPTCLEAKKQSSNTISVNIEKGLHVDLLGETKISVHTTNQKEVWDEIEEEINPNFLEK